MKNLWKFALLFAGALTFTACSDEDKNPNPDPDPVVTVTGVYVLSEGNYNNNIAGDLTLYNPETKEVSNGLFKSVNERALSGTSNDGVVYGSKLYIANTDENIIEVCDAKTARSIGKINLNGARCVEPYDGKIYVTSFTGAKVAKIDTTSLAVEATAEVGDNPEGLVISNNKLYVANSGYGMGNTVTKINLANFEVEATLTVPTNPVDVFAEGNELFLLSSGKYKADYSGYEENPAIYAMTADGVTTKICDATIAAIGGGKIYLVDNNYYSTTGIGYQVYDIATKQVGAWELEEKPFSPYAIGVNPSNGDIYVTSHNSIDYGTGVLYPDYSGNGYTLRFDKDNKKLDRFNIGVNAGTVIFF